MIRCAVLAFVLVLGLRFPACEVTLEAERGDHEAMVLCTLTGLPDWWAALRRLVRSAYPAGSTSSRATMPSSAGFGAG